MKKECYCERCGFDPRMGPDEPRVCPLCGGKMLPRRYDRPARLLLLLIPFVGIYLLCHALNELFARVVGILLTAALLYAVCRFFDGERKESEHIRALQNGSRPEEYKK